MCVPIQRVSRNATGRITHIGGSTQDGAPWGLLESEAIARIQSRLWEFFVEIPAGARVPVWVRTVGGTTFLTTSPDGTKANNLDSLPDMPQPLSGVEPQFPLSIPGQMTLSLETISSVGFAVGNGALTPMPIGSPLIVDGSTHDFLEPASFFGFTIPWFWLDAMVPFPANYAVFENGLGVSQVDPDDFQARSALEAAGKGWWSLNFVLTRPDGSFDHSLPARVTPVKVVIRTSVAAWNSHNFTLALNTSSMNPFCLGGGEGITFRIREQAAAQTPPPPHVTMPAVVGKQLDAALMQLTGLGLKNISVIAPTAPASDETVDTQNPANGTQVKLTDPVGLTASLTNPMAGFKSIKVTNQANSGHDLDLWLFNLETGQWDKKDTVNYQDDVSVDLDDGHNFLLAAVDPKAINCQSASPRDGDCIYSAPLMSFFGDSSGDETSWTIT